MRRPKPKCSGARKQRRLSEAQEIQLLDSWIEAGIPDPGTNPLAISPPPHDAPIGRTKDGGFSPYAGVRFFRQLPISQRTKDGLAPKYVEMSDIQRASLPHSLCGRDILGAAKTGSGKTLAFVIPVRKLDLVKFLFVDEYYIDMLLKFCLVTVFCVANMLKSNAEFYSTVTGIQIFWVFFLLLNAIIVRFLLLF